MWSVCKKELRQFFSSLTGYIAILVFLLVNGLVLFVFPDNIFDFGYATLDRFFQLAPWILLLLIPAITMRSFSDEFKSGTYEILQTKPLTRAQIISGKYLGSFFVAVIALLPTLVYIISIQQLSAGKGLDMGATIGSCFYRYRYLLQQFYIECGRGIYCRYDRLCFALLWFQRDQPAPGIGQRRGLLCGDDRDRFPLPQYQPRTG